MARIFLALTLEKNLNDKIIEIKRGLKSNLLKDANISWQLNDHHHLTIYFIGEMEPEQIDQMNEDLTKINFTGLSRTINLVAVSFFPNENSQVLSILVKPNPPLQTLHDEIEKIVVNLGLGSDLKNFKPHITLGRFKEKNRPHYEFDLLEEPFNGKIKQLDVLETEFSEGKTRYTLLKSFEF